MEPLLLKAGTNESGKTFLLKNYFIHRPLKESKKGNVYLATDYDGWLRSHFIIIKHGSGEIQADEFGRTMGHRLKWQMYLHQTLPAALKLPRIKEYFRYKFNYYLVMEHVNGTPLREILSSIYEKDTWKNLNSHNKMSVLTLVISVVDVIQIMHDAGFIHRDITPENFLIKPDGNVIMIDLELAHPIYEKHPTPPYALGTPGFMSPEQRLGRVPTAKEDIYGLGALMLTAFTNLPPLKFDVENPEALLRAMSFLEVPETIKPIIQHCFSEEKSERPELSEIREGLQEVMDLLERPTYKDLEDMLQKAFRGLINDDLRDKHSLYRGKSNAGLTVPIHGILYLIGEYGIEKTPNSVLSFIKQDDKDEYSPYNEMLETKFPGLFCGLAGNAVALYCASDIWLPEQDRALVQQYEWTKSTAATLGLADGVAGQALAVLLILQKKPTELLKEKLAEYIAILLTSQSRDGSWPVEHTRLADGKAGILLTLIKCYQYHTDLKLRSAIKNGLVSLEAELYPAREVWSNKKKAGVTDTSLMGGTCGIALVFLYAYEIWREPADKETADKLLTELTELPYSFDFSLESGLAGIGLVYIQAAKVTHNDRWMKRIMWIYQLLDHMKITNSEDNIHWNTRGVDSLDASLLSGNAGIIYFLIKLQQLRNPVSNKSKHVTLI
jgi:serine/threonine protein kinase